MSGALAIAQLTSLPLSAELQTLVLRLQESGIQVQVLSDCRPRLKGQYLPGARRLVLCPTNFRRDSDLRDTLTHEAVHAAQFCAGSLLFTPAERDQLQSQLSERNRVSLMLYSPGEIPKEIEARALEAQPQQVAELVAHHCRRMAPTSTPTQTPSFRPSSPARSGS